MSQELIILPSRGFDFTRQREIGDSFSARTSVSLGRMLVLDAGHSRRNRTYRVATGNTYYVLTLTAFSASNRVEIQRKRLEIGRTMDSVVQSINAHCFLHFRLIFSDDRSFYV